MNATRLDVFKSVHKGLRRALYTLAMRAGITSADSPEDLEALARLAREVFRFLEHHARNENLYLVPRMQAHLLDDATRLVEEHAELDAELAALSRIAETGFDTSSDLLHAFYLNLNRFIGSYLLHLDSEETQVLPRLHQAFSDAELAEFSQQSVANTAPADQAMMLGHMFPAMQDDELWAFFTHVRTKAPRESVVFLEDLAKRVLGPRAGACFAPSR